MKILKVVALIIVLVMICMFLGSCELPDTAKSEETEKNTSALVVISTKRIAEDLFQYSMYDPDTMVMYSFFDGYKSGGCTVMYNADGTPKLYHGD